LNALVLDIGKDGHARTPDAFRSMGEDDIRIDARKGVLRRARQMKGRLVVWGHGGHEGHAAARGSKREGLIAKRTVEKVEFAAQLGR
jgi:hypothetical protein